MIKNTLKAIKTYLRNPLIPSKNSFTFEGKSEGNSFNSFKNFLHFFFWRKKLKELKEDGNSDLTLLGDIMELAPVGRDKPEKRIYKDITRKQDMDTPYGPFPISSWTEWNQSKRCL